MKKAKCGTNGCALATSALFIILPSLPAAAARCFCIPQSNVP
jgi:hypothetical protein